MLTKIVDIQELKAAIDAYSRFLNHTKEAVGISTGEFHLEFHINTKLSHALRYWFRDIQDPKQVQAFQLWCGEIADFAKSLPQKQVKDGTTCALVNPYARLQKVFSSGKSAKLSDTLTNAWDIAYAISGQQVNQTYVNLFELCKWTGAEVSLVELESTYKRAYGQMPGNKELIQQLLDDPNTIKLNLFDEN